MNPYSLPPFYRARWPSGRASDSGVRGGGGGSIPTSAVLCP